MRSVSASLIDGEFTEAEIIDPLPDQRRRPPIPAALLDDSPAPGPRPLRSPVSVSRDSSMDDRRTSRLVLAASMPAAAKEARIRDLARR